MVFKHDERPALDEFHCFPFMHSREVHSRIPQDSDAGWEAGEAVDKEKVHGSEKSLIHTMEYFGSNEIIAIPTHQSSAHADVHISPRLTSDRSCGIDRPEGKHVRLGEELCMVSCKRTRHEVPCNEPPPTDSFPLKKSASELPAAVHGESGENVDALGEEKPCVNPVEVFCAGNSSGNQTKNSCNCCDPDGEAEWDPTRRKPLSPRFYGRGHPSSKETSEDLLFSFCDRYPRKHVAMGSDHQVDIPSWFSQSSTDFDKDNGNKLIGTPVLSMPDDSSKAAHEMIGVGGDANGCNCIDKGSIGCTRRHVAEVRERMRQKLGLKKFVELGFHDMGEDVALGWNEDEELLFEKIVISNPASMGMNFWNVLPRFFPSRSTQDLVSYYYNVFMLKKRAAQNRIDPWNVDSDDDEWQESDDGEFTADDSAQGVYYQSSVDQEVVYLEGEEGEGQGEEDEEDAFREETDEEEGMDEPGITSKTYVLEQPDLSPKPKSAGFEEHDAQDESCTSYEGQHGGVDSGADPFAVMASAGTAPNAPGKNIHEEFRSNSSSTACIPGCVHREWDVGYHNSGKVDFLPTCYVIEEVFGKDSQVD